MCFWGRVNRPSPSQEHASNLFNLFRRVLSGRRVTTTHFPSHDVMWPFSCARLPQSHLSIPPFAKIVLSSLMFPSFFARLQPCCNSAGTGDGRDQIAFGPVEGDHIGVGRTISLSRLVPRQGRFVQTGRVRGHPRELGRLI